MTGTPKADVLIAKWTSKQDVTTDAPHSIAWASGVAATHDEYLDHIADTHTWVVGPNGAELHIFPRIVVEIRYDRVAGKWVPERRAVE